MQCRMAALQASYSTASRGLMRVYNNLMQSMSRQCLLPKAADLSQSTTELPTKTSDRTRPPSMRMPSSHNGVTARTPDVGRRGSFVQFVTLATPKFWRCDQMEVCIRESLKPERTDPRQPATFFSSHSLVRSTPNQTVDPQRGSTGNKVFPSCKARLDLKRNQKMVKCFF